MDAKSTRAAWVVPVDPVCGRLIEPVPIPYDTDHADMTFYFCSARCQGRFQADPTAFLCDPDSAVQRSAPGEIRLRFA